MGIGVHLGFGVLDGKKIYAAYPQLEEKPFATSFVDGSRAAGKLVYPNLYRPRHGTISMRVMFDLDPADWPSFQCLCDWSTSLNDRMLLYTNNQLLKFYVKDATNSIVASIDLGASGQNISAGVWYSVSITWDFNGNACLYFEDVSVTSDISSLSLTAGEINLTVGTDYLFGNFLNGLIDEFRIMLRETFTPIAFKFGDISGSATLAVESIDIEIDDTSKTLAAIVLNEDIRNKWAILSVGAIDSEYVVHVQEFLRGIIGGWQLYDENTLKITITNELVLWNKKPLRIQMSSCPWVFKGTECAYSGEESTCDQTYERCRFLGNTANFGGDRFINSLMQKEIWWGRTQKL
jgi:hypothetical protein